MSVNFRVEISTTNNIRNLYDADLQNEETISEIQEFLEHYENNSIDVKLMDTKLKHHEVWKQISDLEKKYDNKSKFHKYFSGSSLVGFFSTGGVTLLSFTSGYTINSMDDAFFYTTLGLSSVLMGILSHKHYLVSRKFRKYADTLEYINRKLKAKVIK